MESLIVKKPLLPWWAAGLMLGLIQIMAVGLNGPLGVSTQFVVADTQIINQIAPQYAQNHPLISQEKYQKIGYGWWLDIGLIVGAFVAAVLSWRWRPRITTIWWQANRGKNVAGRLIAGFIGGFLILLGARLAHGCTSGQFASGWAQLSLSVVPFTITMFVFGMITAFLVYPKAANFEK